MPKLWGGIPNPKGLRIWYRLIKENLKTTAPKMGHWPKECHLTIMIAYADADFLRQAN